MPIAGGEVRNFPAQLGPAKLEDYSCSPVCKADTHKKKESAINISGSRQLGRCEGNFEWKSRISRSAAV